MTLSDNTLQDYPTKFELELTESTINNPETAFMIEDVPESQTSHIYKLNLALSAIEDSIYNISLSLVSTESSITFYPDRAFRPRSASSQSEFDLSGFCTHLPAET